MGLSIKVHCSGILRGLEKCQLFCWVLPGFENSEEFCQIGVSAKWRCLLMKATLKCYITYSPVVIVSRITDGISDIKIVNKEVWRPLPRFQRTKKFPKEDLTADEDKKPLSSCTAYKLKSPKQRDTIPDKIEDLSATAEMDLTAKSCIESGAEFKVLFVPGYEVDKKAEFYEDPLKIGGLNVTSIKRASVNRQDPFISRVVALRKLDDETTATEDKQKRLENLLYPSRYNGAYRERKISIERRTITAKSPQCGSSADCQLKARGAPPTPSRRNRVTGGKKGFNSVEGIFDTAKSSHKRVVSDYKALTYVCDRTSSEDTDSLQGNEQSNNAMTKVSAKSPRRRRSKCGASPDSQTSQMFDATDVTAKYLVPCGEKIKDTGKRKRQNYSPGKSFFSQRKNSLTKPSNKRPATAEVRKKKTSTPKRPNTASVDTRKQASERV